MHSRRYRFFALVLVLITLAYGLFEARTLLRGPILEVHSPAPGDLITDSVYTVNGTAQNVTRVLVNGQPVNLDLEGTFSQKLVTPDGYSVILVEAENRFGRQSNSRIEFVGRPPSNTE